MSQEEAIIYRQAQRIVELEKDLAACREESREDHDTLRNFLHQEAGREGDIKRPIGAAISVYKILKDRTDKAEQERDALRSAFHKAEVEMSEAGKIGFAAISAECLHMWLDKRMVPRAANTGEIYSLVGRVEEYVKKGTP